MAMARFTATVVFPSPGNDDTTSNTCGGFPGLESITEVWRERKASASGECGRSSRKLTPGGSLPLLEAPPAGIAGSPPRVADGIWSGSTIGGQEQRHHRDIVSAHPVANVLGSKNSSIELFAKECQA